FFDKAEARFKLYNSESTGDRFFEEARAILAGQEDQSLPTIQALALMSLREASCGRSDVSELYGLQSIRMAVASELHLDQFGYPGFTFSSEEREVRSTTFWGCFALDQARSLFIGGVPHISRRAIRAPVPPVVEYTETEEGTAYQEEVLPPEVDTNSLRESGLVFRSICGLSTRINDALYLLYEPGGELKIQKILDLHTQYLQWYGSLPEAKTSLLAPCSHTACSIIALSSSFFGHSFGFHSRPSQFLPEKSVFKPQGT
ncbi:MAG: hypothetical protein M1835_001721, partial [Candelina submexicana]